MWSWLVATPTMRAGVSSPETDSSDCRWALCSSESWCWSAERRTWPLARKACATTTASNAATTSDTDMMMSTRPWF